MAQSPSQAAPTGLHNLKSPNLSENAASLVLGQIPRKQSGGGERLYNQADNACNAHAKHPVDKIYSAV